MTTPDFRFGSTTLRVARLVRHGGEFVDRDLCAQLGIHRNSLTYSLNRLEFRGALCHYNVNAARRRGPRRIIICPDSPIWALVDALAEVM